MYINFIIFFIVLGCSLIGVELYRRLSLRRKMLDYPNERSSHTAPTPRGGGAVVVGLSVGTLFIYAYFENLVFFLPYLVGAAVISGISLIDDIKTLSPFWRIIFHGLAAAIAVYFYGGFGEVLIPFYGTVNLMPIGHLLAFLWIVWLVNAYNFMDGIDGIAALQAVTAAIGWSIISIILGVSSLQFYGAVLAAASLGFLFHNWQPSRIFMGDVGSAFLGYTFAVLPLIAAKQLTNTNYSAIVLWIAVILVWFFILDSCLTFFRRLLRGEKVWLAHREHIYQKMVIAGLSHASVATLYGVLSFVLQMTLTAALSYHWDLERTVIVAIIVESFILAVFWRAVIYRSRKRNRAKNY